MKSMKSGAPLSTPERQDAISETGGLTVEDRRAISDLLAAARDGLAALEVVTQVGMNSLSMTVVERAKLNLVSAIKKAQG